MHQVVREAIYKRLLFGHCKKGGEVNRNADFLADPGKARGSSTNRMHRFDLVSVARRPGYFCQYFIGWSGYKK